jgi:hypothetical protein
MTLGPQRGPFDPPGPVVDLVGGCGELLGQGDDELALAGGGDGQLVQAAQQPAAPASAVGSQGGFHPGGDRGGPGDRPRR